MATSSDVEVRVINKEQDGRQVETKSDQKEVSVDRSAQEYIKSNFRLFLARTIFIYLAYVCLGLNIGEMGPTFLDLLQVVDTDVARGSVFYTGGSVGYAFGALLSGFLYDVANRDCLLFLALFGMGCFNVAQPWGPRLWLMTTVNAMRGATLASLDTGGNVVCLGMWKDEGSPYLQALHLSFSIGGVIAPFIAEPFLSATSEKNSTSGLRNATLHLQQSSFGFLDNSSMIVTNTTEPETRVHFAYLIIGSITVASSLPFLVLFLRHKFTNPPGENAIGEDQGTSEETAMSHTGSELPIRLKLVFLGLLGIFYMSYVSLESTGQGYLLTFVVRHLGWTKSEGARITSVFWGVFACGRLVGIVMSKFLTPWKMLLVDLVLVNCVLLPLGFVTRDRDFIMWICLPLSGLFMASIFPAGISWTDQRIMKFTGKVASVFIISSTLGGIFFPMLLGYLFEYITPLWYAYLLTVEAGVCMVVFILLTTLLWATEHSRTYHLGDQKTKR